ncbi:mitochondrial thiamine pyrophosphate carrier isoform X1 [Drosophila pseudoobscura]|uniref:Mitochondrial thiamine pyrophosphate carrier isoform X1 n=1 Tax=Drosophila pseudoobscura pseudoobscura TaxID=46245 RepID=A0A6I8USM2_DROPS|nr:mitochondrial thiamine pyrophosphate carrier isoform X1 [Drosophila pseudoobscura]
MPDNTPLVQLLQALGGGVAGGLTRTLVQPFDVIKIRFQMQVEPVGKHGYESKYQGLLHAFRSIYKEEGLRGIWRGHNSGQVLSITYAVVQFWSYEQLRVKAHKMPFFDDRPLLLYFVCGGLAGCLGTVAAQPFDVIRTQVVAADPTSKRSRMSSLRGVHFVHSTEGLRGLSRGLVFTLAQIFPLVGANFLIYKYLNALVLFIVKKSNPDHNIPGPCLFVNGALAGVSSKLLVYPADLMKKRMQLHGFHQDRQTFGRNPICPTAKQCFMTTLKGEGISGFYKGVSPTLLKSGLSSAFYFTFYDYINRYVIHPMQDREEQRLKEEKAKSAAPKKAGWT